MKFSLVFVSLVSLALFSSCGSDKNESGNGGNNNASNPINLVGNNSCINDMVNKINAWSTSSYSGSRTTMGFRYYQNADVFTRDNSQGSIDTARNRIRSIVEDFGVCDTYQQDGGTVWSIRSRSNSNLLYTIALTPTYPLWANPAIERDYSNGQGYYQSF